jgi:3-hydroxy-9,10-secoandrosta-1,3,5(10)-triene-9,17-dione monooxygenase reductase component
MSVDARAFRQTVGHFVTGVTIIATEVDGAIRAMTANSFTSLSLDPPLVLFCVGKNTNMGQLIRTSSGFSVNILQHDQEALSTYFAGGWKEPSPPIFSFSSWAGGPLLDRCVAALGCAVEAIHEGGDHWIVVGRVLSLYRSEEECRPLVFRGGRYARLVDPAEVP